MPDPQALDVAFEAFAAATAVYDRMMVTPTLRHKYLAFGAAWAHITAVTAPQPV